MTVLTTFVGKSVIPLYPRDFPHEMLTVVYDEFQAHTLQVVHFFAGTNSKQIMAAAQQERVIMIDLDRANQ